PGAAALMGVTVLMLLALVGGGVSLIYSGQAQELLREAQHQRDEATKAAREADRQRARGDRLLYLNQIALAQREIENNEFGRAVYVLDDCQWDLRGWEWHYLRRVAGLVGCAEDHTSSAHGVCFSPDGLSLAGASVDRTVRVWDAGTGQQVRVLKG